MTRAKIFTMVIAALLIIILLFNLLFIYVDVGLIAIHNDIIIPGSSDRLLLISENADALHPYLKIDSIIMFTDTIVILLLVYVLFKFRHIKAISKKDRTL